LTANPKKERKEGESDVDERKLIALINPLIY